MSARSSSAFASDGRTCFVFSFSARLDEASRLEALDEFGCVAEATVELGCEFRDCLLTVEGGKRAELAYNYESI